MIAIKNAIIDEISSLQLLPVFINGLPHLTSSVARVFAARGGLKNSPPPLFLQ